MIGSVGFVSVFLGHCVPSNYHSAETRSTLWECSVET